MRRVAALVGLASVCLVVVAPAASAAAPTNGCPSGYALMSVADLTAQGYRIPAVVDDPANLYGFGHQPGNADGWVCARALGIPSAEGVLYQFFDNTLPASG
jgi:hypothetical protein